MSKHDSTKARVLDPRSRKNIGFDELCSLLTHMGFISHQKGSHRIFRKAHIPHIVNLQPGSDGKAKPYQVKQVAEIIETFGL